MSTETIRTIQRSEIRTDGGTQSRAALNQETVNDYAAAMREGGEFPPVVVYHDGAELWLADGFHRIAAAQAVGRAHVSADIRQGTRRDAVLHSVGANAQHGLRRNRDDVQRAIAVLLRDDEWCQWSDREIARRVGCSDKTVGALRKSLEASAEIPQIAERKTERGGATYTQAPKAPSLATPRDNRDTAMSRNDAQPPPAFDRRPIGEIPELADVAAGLARHGYVVARPLGDRYILQKADGSGVQLRLPDIVALVKEADPPPAADPDLDAPLDWSWNPDIDFQLIHDVHRWLTPVRRTAAAAIEDVQQMTDGVPDGWYWHCAAPGEYVLRRDSDGAETGMSLTPAGAIGVARQKSGLVPPALDDDARAAAIQTMQAELERQAAAGEPLRLPPPPALAAPDAVLDEAAFEATVAEPAAMLADAIIDHLEELCERLLADYIDGDRAGARDAARQIVAMLEDR